MASLFDQIPVPELLGAGEGALDEYLEPCNEQPVRSRRHSIKQFCQNVLHSREYRESLLRRIDSDTLPAGVETMLYYFAYGKPVERVEFNDVTETNLENASTEELTERAAKLLRTAQSVKEKEQKNIRLLN
jgi:hypothetical protein